MRHILKTLPGKFEYKASGATDGIIEGYASSWNRDLVGDRIEKGAYTKTIIDRVANKRVRLLDNHNAYESLSVNVAGLVTDALEDNHGLYIKATFAPTQPAQNLRLLCQSGMLSDFSVGIRIIKDSWESATNTRLIQECMLREVSIVMDPANPDAVMHAVKSTNQSAHYFPVAPADTPFDAEAAKTRYLNWAKSCPVMVPNGFLYFSQEAGGGVDGIDARYPLVDIIQDQPMLIPAAVAKAAREITASTNLPLSAKMLKDALQPFIQKAGIAVDDTKTNDDNAEIVTNLYLLKALLDLPLR